MPWLCRPTRRSNRSLRSLRRASRCAPRSRFSANVRWRQTNMAVKRPIPVWIIAILCILAGLSQLLSHTAIIAGLVPLDQRTQAVVASWSLLDKLAPFLLSILLLSAAIALFRMKRIAFHLYVAYLALVTLATVQQAITTRWVEQFGSAAWSAVAGVALFAAVVWYVHRLRAGGKLE